MITAAAKKLFFDSAAVRKMLDDQTQKALSRAGAFVRQRAKTSIRSRKKVSDAGTPPSSHTGDLKRLIWFAYDPGSQSVVIGPVRFKQGDAPNLLEFGGTAKRQRRGGKSVITTYRPRPFMGPALDKEIPKLAALWGKSVKGSG